MSDHYHYGYADDRHDHSLDYAERHHRHYDDESTAAGLREDLGRAESRISDLEDEIATMRKLLTAIETRLHDHEQAVPHEEAQA